jgi:hypothetical protein
VTWTWTWFGLVWVGVVWVGVVWFGLVWFGLVWRGFPVLASRIDGQVVRIQDCDDQMGRSAIAWSRSLSSASWGRGRGAEEG